MHCYRLHPLPRQVDLKLRYGTISWTCSLTDVAAISHQLEENIFLTDSSPWLSKVYKLGSMQRRWHYAGTLLANFCHSMAIQFRVQHQYKYTIGLCQ